VVRGVGVRTDSLIGTEFLDYRIEELIGHGGMGVVYRAHDARLDRSVALKLVAPELAQDERFRERFLRESKLAASLEHPNVVPVHDAGEVDGQLYLAMRYVEGSDLRTLLRAEAPLAPARAVAICTPVAEALDSAHARGLVHRDVKPSNVLLDASERAYLADFGLSRRLADEGTPFADGHSLGTPAYVAPEQIEQGAVDGRADVYALGCVLFECLTGEPPFVRDSRLGLVWAHLEEEPPRATERNPQLPPAVDAVLAKALAKDAGERYATCSELVTAARDALGLAAPSPRRSRIAVAAALVALLAVAVAGASLFVGRDGAQPTDLLLRKNTVVRIDPATNEVAAVIDVGRNPTAVAAAGGTVWAYNADDETVSEIDADTNTVRRTVPLAAPPVRPSPMGAVWTGPLLAADTGGAWIPGADFERGVVSLTRILSGGGKREYRLPVGPTAVTVGGGSVWVLARDLRGPTLVRISPTSGAVVARARLRSAAEAGGIAYGEGAVWVSAWVDATRQVAGHWKLFRVDPASSAVTGTLRFGAVGQVAVPPTVGLGAVWVGMSRRGGSLLRVAPRRPRVLEETSAPFGQRTGFVVAGPGALWWTDAIGGRIARLNELARVEAILRVTPPTRDEHVLSTALAVGAGGVWTTVGRGLPGQSGY